MIAKTPEPPYYAVIFSSRLSDEQSGYGAMAEQMIELAKQQDGFLGIESARETIGITVSYWRDLQAIQDWKHHTKHQLAQQLGRSKWYDEYVIRIALVEDQKAF